MVTFNTALALHNGRHQDRLTAFAQPISFANILLVDVGGVRRERDGASALTRATIVEAIAGALVSPRER